MRLVGDPAGAPGTYDMRGRSPSTGSTDLVFAYDNVTGPLDDVTIGAENAAGTTASTLVNNGDAAEVITDDTVVCLAYQAADVDAANFTYQVTVDDDVHNRQVLTNNAVHTTSDPGAKLATATATVTVGSAEERSETAFVSQSDDRRRGRRHRRRRRPSSPRVSPKATGTVEFLVNGAVAATAPVGATGVATAQLTGPAACGHLPGDRPLRRRRRDARQHIAAGQRGCHADHAGPASRSQLRQGEVRPSCSRPLRRSGSAVARARSPSW